MERTRWPRRNFSASVLLRPPPDTTSAREGRRGLPEAPETPLLSRERGIKSPGTAA